MFTISQIKSHLGPMLHGGTLSKVRNIEQAFERAGSVFLLNVDPLEVIRNTALTSLIHDDVYNYSLPDDFGKLLDLIPDEERTSWDNAFRIPGRPFDLTKAVKNRTISIEGSEGEKIIRINWRARKGKVLNAMDSLTANGTWTAIGGATGLKVSTIYKKTGSGSIEFDVPTTGGGIQNTTMTVVDMTTEDEIADNFTWVQLGSDFAHLTSITPRWGNDVTTNYWLGTAQTTQADGTPFKQGWNRVKVSWVSSTENGSVNPATIDSYQLTFQTTSALANVRVDNILFSIGRNFDLKYYSKFLYKNSGGVWISLPTSDDDIVMVDNDTLPQFLFECLKVVAHQIEGEDSVFDMNTAEKELEKLYPKYTGNNPSQVKKSTNSIGNRKFGRRRW